MHRINPVGKGKRPKFELHLKIYDLNNVPLVSGTSYIKWHLEHSMHAEHRGRTAKCPIVNHRVDYAFSKIIPHIRIALDKNNQLVECPIELEIVQEFAVTEKITLGGGIRVGTPAVTTRGMKEGEMKQIAAWIDRALKNREDEAVLAQIRSEVSALNKNFPLP